MKKIAPAVMPVFIISYFNFPSLKKHLSSLSLVCLFALLRFSASAQDSSHIRISLLTCSPGEELYSTWGHTAIRVTDSSSVTDIVFNYGTFNFEDPGFYTKFVRGKLLYYLSFQNFNDFKDDYQAENRVITEQVLNMGATEKIAMMEALHQNSKEQHRYYKYDFFFDNCTTRPRDMVLRYQSVHPPFKPVMKAGTRFRQAIHQNLDKYKKYWSELGIDILLGAPTDAVMTTKQSQFLPDNLMMALDTINQDHQLVLSTRVYNIKGVPGEEFVISPMLVFSLLLVVIALLSFSPHKKVKAFLEGFDGVFFFLTGLLGILLIFMWLGTDHLMTKNNYNLLWAWPTNSVMAFFVNSKKKWAGRYFVFHTAGLIIVLLGWAFLPQQMNNAIIPLVLLLIIRSAGKF